MPNRYLQILSLLSLKEKVFITLTVIIRILLVGLDLIGVALVGVTVAIASGTRASEESVTGRLLAYLGSLGTTNYYALIAAAAAAFFLFKSIFSVWLNTKVYKFTARLEFEKSETAFTKILFGNLEQLEKLSEKETQYTLSTSFQITFSTFINNFSVALGEIFLLIAISIFLAATNLMLFLLMALYLFIVGLVMNFVLGRRVKKHAQEVQDATLELGEVLHDTYRNFRQLHSVPGESSFEIKFARARKKLAFGNSNLAVIANLPRYITELALMFGLGFLVLQRAYSPGDNASAMVIAIFVAGAFRIVASMLPLQAALSGLKHVETVSAGALEVMDRYKMTDTLTDLEITEQVSPTPAISIANLSYRYSGAQKSLEFSDLRIPFGSMVAIVGKSGVGKSTFADLVLGLRTPTTGEILIDGLDARLISKQAKGLVNYVPQKTGLIAGTIAENVTLANGPSFEDKNKVWRILRELDLEIAVKNLPDGLETKIDHRGDYFSGGQMQRLGLARALFQNPKILVLDEVTSALDDVTQELVATYLEKLRGEMTILVIAHRKSTIEFADHVYKL